VTVISGANNPDLEVAGKTVGEIRQQFGDALNISPTAKATVNGNPAGNTTRLKDGDTLAFQKEVAQKGV
jgi:hypothetical protein